MLMFYAKVFYVGAYWTIKNWENKGYKFFGGIAPHKKWVFRQWVSQWVSKSTAFHPFPIDGFWWNFYGRWVLVISCRGRNFYFDGRCSGVENEVLEVNFCDFLLKKWSSVASMQLEIWKFLQMITIYLQKNAGNKILVFFTRFKFPHFNFLYESHSFVFIAEPEIAIQNSFSTFRLKSGF